MIKPQKVIKCVFRYEIEFSLKNSGFSYLYGSISYFFGYEKNRCFLASDSLAPQLANCKESCTVNHTLQSDIVPTLTTTRAPEICTKSTSVILSTSKVLESVTSVAPPPDMASTTIEADSTTRAPNTHQHGDMHVAQYADSTQQQSAMINRRVPDKTHTRQMAPELCGMRTGVNLRHVGEPPPRADDDDDDVFYLFFQKQKRTCRPFASVRTPHSVQPSASPPTSVGHQPGPMPRCAGVARRLW